MNYHELAQLRNPVLPPFIGDPKVGVGGTALGLMISNLIGGLFIVSFLIAFIYLIIGGFHWITSAGDKANLESARNRITHAIVGLIVVAAAWAIATIAAQFVGLGDFMHLPIPTIPSN